jgi:hypothetical protein
MSFALTTQQVLEQTKTVTRRIGWRFLYPGMLICAVKKAMGLQPGEKLERLAILRVIHVNREPLCNITNGDCITEGFPGLYSNDFIQMFCEHMHCAPETEVTRIEFEYISEERINLFVEDQSQPIGEKINEAMRRGIEEALRAR